MSRNRVSPSAGYCAPSKLPKGPNGRNLCRQCSVEVKPPRLTFCSDDCVDSWKVKTQPGFVRRLLLKRDKGVCAICRVDCLAAERWLNAEAARLERERVSLYSLRDFWPIAAKAWFVRCNELGLKPDRHFRSLWEADHAVPVVEGGGECGLEGFRTLCRRCHRIETTALARRLAEKRKAGKERFRAALDESMRDPAVLAVLEELHRRGD